MRLARWLQRRVTVWAAGAVLVASPGGAAAAGGTSASAAPAQPIMLLAQLAASARDSARSVPIAAQDPQPGQPVSAQPGTLPGPPTPTPGDAARGRAIVADRQLGLCLLCHSGPIAEERFQGDLAPSLAGAGSRWSAAELRQRLLEPRRLSPASIMPSYGRVDGLTRVGAAWRGKPLLEPQQVEDVVAFLSTLRDPAQ